VHREDVVEPAHRDEVLAVVKDPARDARAAGLGERVVQEAVRALALVLAAEVVGPVEPGTNTPANPTVPFQLDRNAIRARYQGSVTGAAAGPRRVA
jgi:hypothetical protein